MTRINDARSAEIQTLFSDLAKEYGVVGASLAVLDDGETHTFATGLASLRKQEAATPDHLFLVGSTTKVYTATLVMQLVDEGLVELDAPVKRYIPDFQLPDAEATETVTVRQLLNHTSGIDNGPYANHGQGDDAVERYVASLADVPLVHRPGQRYGYSNAALVTAGRVVECVTGQTWDDAMRERLLIPGGLHASFTMPGDAILHPVAVPHVSDEDGNPVVAAQWGVADRAMGPTGSTLCTTAADLARFAGLHLNDGRAPDGTQVLSPESVAAMQDVQVQLPPNISLARNWCVGWLSDNWSGRQVLGHTGHNIGSGSFLRLIPEENAALALVFNSGGDAPLYHYLFKQLLCELYGIDKPDPWVPIEPEADIDLEAYAGTYARHGFQVHLEVQDGALVVTETDESTEDLPEALRGQKFRPANRHAFGTGAGDKYQVTPPDGNLSPNFVFDGFEDGRPQFLYTVVFATPRIA